MSAEVIEIGSRSARECRTPSTAYQVCFVGRSELPTYPSVDELVAALRDALNAGCTGFAVQARRVHR
jgi:hypothetical protein